MEQGKVKKYLAYAIGEIFLIVVGILIALQISNYTDEQQDRKLEKQALMALVRELDETIRDIDVVTAGNTRLLEELDELLAKLSAGPETPAEQREFYMLSVKSTYWYLRIEFSNSTLSQLKFNGDFRLIQSPAIIEKIHDYDLGVVETEFVYSEVMRYFQLIEESQKDLLNLQLAKRAYEYIEEDFMRMLLPVSQFEDMVEEGDYFSDTSAKGLRDYYGDVLFYRTALNNTVFLSLEQKNRAIALRDMINQYYGIQ